MYQDRYWHEDYFAAVEELTGIAQTVGMSLLELSFQWLLSQTQVDSVVLGASRLEQLEENLDCCEQRQLDHDTLDHCDHVWKRLRGVTPRYNR
jgi:aryl-alcohol dehydrogenase-like predicted oxidoreductase